MSREDQLKDFFQAALAGESKSYDDHNWYSSGGLRSFVAGRSKSPYPLLPRPISQMTIGQLKTLQNRRRDAKGQIWAIGRYQIIPNTLRSMQRKAGLSDSDYFNPENQNKLGWQLLVDRKPVADYLSGKVPDNEDTLRRAALEISKIWSSVGVPYSVNGVGKDQSYYSRGGERASVSSAVIQEKLRQLRTGAVQAAKQVKAAVTKAVEVHPLATIAVTALVIGVGYAIYDSLKSKKN